ncbi:MAG: hypothetical protein Q4E65_00265 [Clostridia bacterium]|nr:hypothetical protein [Clostridia bacterium]
MKKGIMRLIALLLVLGMLSACGTKPAASLPPEVPTVAAAEEPAVGLPNPIVEVDGYKALTDAVPGTMLSDAPVGASDVTYSYINGEPIISQIMFTYGGNEYTYRAAQAAENAQQDISGVYDALPKTSENNATDGGVYKLQYDGKTTIGLATWYYAPTGCQYSLFTPTGCDVSQQIEEVVDALLPIDTGAEETAQKPPVTGEVTGKVLQVETNDIIVNLDDDSTHVFMLTHIYNVEAKPGDVVKITYGGDLSDSPEALEIEVQASEKAEQMVNGTISQCEDNFVHVKTETDNVYGFIVDKDTKLTGAAKALKENNIVTVTYTGDLTNMPVAKKIDTVVVVPDAPDPLVNKTLKGTVKSLASKSFVLHTDSGSNYTFPKDGNTKISGKYDLAKGAKVKVTYDGYASKSPYAKKIEVLAPADPTPPSPTPVVTPTQLYSVSGRIISKSGNVLAIENGACKTFSFILNNAVIQGNGYVGGNAEVTYYVDRYGASVATKVVYSGVTPVPTAAASHTIYGTVIVQAGNAFSVSDDWGQVYSFLLRSPTIVGNGGVGDYVTVTYTDTSSGPNVTRIVYQNRPVPTIVPVPTAVPPVPTIAPVPTIVPVPTAVPPVSHVIYGTVTMQAGNGLVVQSDSGQSYSFLLGAPSISGSGGVGSYVSVTYMDTESGPQVTQLVYISAPAPLVTSDPVVDWGDIDDALVVTSQTAPIGEGAVATTATPVTDWGDVPAIGDAVIAY